MEYQLQRESAGVCEAILDTASEQPVDLELSLPDYCPDIERILKCRLAPSVSSTVVTGDRLDVDGSALVTVWYLDSAKRNIRLCEHQVPFSASFELGEASPDAVPAVRLRPGYVNCRAVGPRKLDIHGAFSVSAAVYVPSVREYCTFIDADDIQQQRSPVTVSCLRGMARRQFSVSEVFDIGKGKGSPESILRYELIYTPGDSRAIDDKLMLRGELTLRVLYVTDIESGARDNMSFSIPVSQVIDVPGISDSTINDISVSVMNSDVMLKSEFDENSTLISLDARLCAVVFAYSDSELMLIDDAYSTDYELDITKEAVKTTRLAGVENISVSARDEIKTGDRPITRVIDLWCDAVTSVCTPSAEGLEIKGKMNIVLFALDSDGIPFCCEKAVDISAALPSGSAAGCSAKAEISVCSPSFRITGDNSIEIKADALITAAVYENKTMRCITSMEVCGDRKKQRDTAAALTIYYAEEGESLWDIARRYCTSTEAIIAENSLPQDAVCKSGMLLIPM